MYTDPKTESRFRKFREWSWLRQSEGRPYVPSTDTAAFEKLDPIVAKYGGDSALSAWDRAAAESGIKLKRPAAIPQPIPADFQAQIDRMSGTELRVRLAKDSQFSDWFGRYSAGEKPEGAVASEEYALTAQQWRSLPVNVAARKMSDPKFRAVVDRLIAAGKI